jgi:hypothetical protein
MTLLAADGRFEDTESTSSIQESERRVQKNVFWLQPSNQMSVVMLKALNVDR